MTKILRWTIGDSNKIGLSILDESIRSAKKNFSHLKLNYVVCSNSDSKELDSICLRNGVDILRTSWESFPLPLYTVLLVDDEGKKTLVPRGRQGSFWKICPPRISLDSHELVCDNDVVFQRIPEELERFFFENKTLVSEDRISSLGKYTKFVDRPYNSGLYGIPPNFDFGQALFDAWQNTGSMCPLLSRDEQGLISLALTIHKNGFLTIPNEKICMAFDEGLPFFAEYRGEKESGYDTQVVSSIQFTTRFFLNSDILHFIGANRRSSHRYWSRYKIKVI